MVPRPKDSPPAQELWTALEALVEKGLTKAIGLANASMSQLTAVLGFSKVSPAVNSVEVWAPSARPVTVRLLWSGRVAF